MFKVICIGKLRPRKNSTPLPSYPKIGNKYTVVRQVVGDLKLYELAEYPVVGYTEHLFDARAFGLADGPDEVQIAEARIAADAAELDVEWGNLVTEIENA